MLWVLHIANATPTLVGAEIAAACSDRIRKAVRRCVNRDRMTFSHAMRVVADMDIPDQMADREHRGKAATTIQARKRGKAGRERVAQLNALGFVWGKGGYLRWLKK